MPAGGCACGNIRISFDSEPSAKVCLSYGILQFLRSCSEEKQIKEKNAFRNPTAV